MNTFSVHFYYNMNLLVLIEFEFKFKQVKGHIMNSI